MIPMTRRVWLLAVASLVMPAVMLAAGFAGYWKGEVASLPVVFRIMEGDGEYSATLDSPMQGAKDIPCGKTTVTGDSISIDMPVLSARYAGRMQAGGGMIAGTFTQHGRSLPLSLSRTTQEAAALYRPQEPKPPFVYNSEEVVFSHDSITLAGTLTAPMWGGRHPAVVLVSGSGIQNRDEEIMGHRPFAVIADWLSRSGIAVLRYDDRGAGGSSPLSDGVTTLDFAEDALAAVDYLKTRRDIDATKIGILGHSEGGTIAFMCASKRSDDVAFVISLAGMAVKGRDLMSKQNRMVAAAVGKPLTTEQETLVDAIFAAIDTIADRNGLETVLREMMARLVDTDEKVSQNVKMMTSPWYTAFVRLDPTAFLEGTKCPVLAINGDWDIQVDAAQNLDAVRRSLPNATVKCYPGLNHLFQEASSKAQSINYGAITQTISPAVLEDIARWIVSVISGKHLESL